MFLIFIFFYLLACDSVYPFNQFFFYFFLISLHAAISAVKFFLPEGYTLYINKLFLGGEGGKGEGDWWKISRDVLFIVISCLTEWYWLPLSFRKNWSAHNSQIIGKLNLHYIMHFLQLQIKKPKNIFFKWKNFLPSPWRPHCKRDNINT